ncbi:hypothetical protein OEZ86_001994 [Tetradesmus obliquus]|nr:hypothetical protein OEZ86_001994 [Tetradesmus obliquus]
MSTSGNGVAVEQLQTPLQGSGPKRMHSNGVSSKKQLAAQPAPKSEQETAQQDLTAAVNSSSRFETQQQEGLQDQQGQAQQQLQPYELQMQEGASVVPAGKMTAPDTFQPEGTAAAAAAAAAHAAPKLPLSRTGTDNMYATPAAGGWPGSSIAVPPLPAALLPAVNSCSDLTQGQLDVLGAWYCLYCPQSEAQQAVALARRYDEKAGFEDNFVKVFGREQIGVMFYLMRRATSGIRMAIEKIEVMPGSSSSSKHGETYQLRIVGRHSFYFPPIIRGPVTSLLLPPALEAWATDVLTVRASDHVVLHHLQRVHNIPTMPWLLRSCLGVSSSLVMMHVLGW